MTRVPPYSPFSLPIGRVLGIPIRVHASWFIVLVVATFSFSQQFDETPGAHTSPVAVAAGLFAALLLFASVLLHELGHCVLARFFGIHVRQIQLFIFGGVAEILGEPRRVLDEVVIAAAGPAVSFVLAFLGIGIGVAFGAHVSPTLDGQSLLPFIALILGAMNLMLAVVNLIPAFPTDGGRIFRAILWGIMGDYRRATSWAAGVGVGFAMLLITIGTGFLFFATGATEAADSFQGVWFVLLGLFLARSATQAKRHAGISAALREGNVSDAMTRIRISAPAERTLLEVFTSAGGPSAAELVLGFPVTEQGKWAGFVEAARIPPKEEWGKLTAGELMTPVASLPAVQLGEPLDLLVRTLTEHNASGALVMSGPDIVGYVDRTDVLRWLIAMQHLPA